MNYRKNSHLRFWRIALVNAVCMGIYLVIYQGLAFGFDPSVLKSVVSVVPKWPKTFPPRTETRDAPEGTAVSIFSGGYLVTNSHVIGNAREVDIRFQNGRLMKVAIVARDPMTDIALLRAPIELPLLPISRETSLGEKVCAVGNQFGLGLSVTCGVVSALKRTNAGFNLIEDFIQTDAVINPGSSGGALVDSQGRLVGIVSAIFTKKSDADIGVNFAADIGLVLRVIYDLKNFGRVKTGISGFSTISLGQEERRVLSGARVVRVKRDGAAQLAGLQVDDVVTHIDERVVVYPSDVRAAIFLKQPGDTIVIQYIRRGLKARTELTLKPSR